MTRNTRCFLSVAAVVAMFSAQSAAAAAASQQTVERQSETAAVPKVQMTAYVTPKVTGRSNPHK